MKIYLQVLTFSITPRTWLFHVVALLTTAKKWTKMKNARAGRAKPSASSLPQDDEFSVLSLRFQPTHTSLIPHQLLHIFNAKRHEIVSQ